jgi:hypothetical protein
MATQTLNRAETEIVAAHAALEGARAAWRHSPNSDTHHACVKAEAVMNARLEHWAIQH